MHLYGHESFDETTFAQLLAGFCGGKKRLSNPFCKTRTSHARMPLALEILNSSSTDHRMFRRSASIRPAVIDLLECVLRHIVLRVDVIVVFFESADSKSLATNTKPAAPWERNGSRKII